MTYYRPKQFQQANEAPDGRLIIPGRLRDRLGSDRLRLHDVAGSLYWAHGNYGLGDMTREYEDAVRLLRTVSDMVERTMTQSMVEYEQRRQAA